MNTGHIFSRYKRRETMPRTKSGEGPGQDFQRSGANPTIFYLFLDLDRGRSGARFLDRTRHDFV